MAEEQDDWGNIFQNGITLKRTLTLAALMERWAGKRVGNYTLNLEGISQLVRQTDQLHAFILIRLLAIRNGERKCLATQISYPEMMRELNANNGTDVVLFDLDEVEDFERDNPLTLDEKREKQPLLTEVDCNPRSRKTLFKFIIGLVELWHINLTETGLATSLEQATEAKGCKLPRSTADQLLREIAEFERNIAN